MHRQPLQNKLEKDATCFFRQVTPLADAEFASNGLLGIHSSPRQPDSV